MEGRLDIDPNVTFEAGPLVVEDDLVYRKSDNTYGRALADSVSNPEKENIVGIAKNVSGTTGDVLFGPIVEYDTSAIAGPLAQPGSTIFLSDTNDGKMTTATLGYFAAC